MYKVFDFNNVLNFIEYNQLSNLEDSSLRVFKKAEIKAANLSNIYNFFIAHQSPLDALKLWYNDYIIIDAAGGLVRDMDNFLWIYRNGKWDLPKGKLDHGENLQDAAKREVMEECGLEGELKIVKEIYVSFHTYIMKGSKVLKRTHWYLMDYNGSTELSPQLEEGITDVKWVVKGQCKEYAMISYPLISEVWNSL